MGCGASTEGLPSAAVADSKPHRKQAPDVVEKHDKVPAPIEEEAADKQRAVLLPAASPPPATHPILASQKSASAAPSASAATSKPVAAPTAVKATQNGDAPHASKALPERIRTEELIKLCQSSHFDRTQVERLYEQFKRISSSGDDDGLIDKSEFQKAMGLKKNIFVDRMFELFDLDCDQVINFPEFVAGLSTFTLRAKREEKAKFSFRMYDFNGDQFIDKTELSRMLQSTIENNNLGIPPDLASKLIDDTFDEIEPATPGQISYDEYWALVQRKPQLLEFMTIQSLTSLIQ